MMLTDRGAIAAMKRVFLVAMLLASSAPAFAQTVFGRVGPQEGNADIYTDSSQAPDARIGEAPVIDHMTGDVVRAKQVCHTVVDNTMTYAVNCAAMASTEYVCPKNGEPCYSFYKIEPAFMGCGRVTKEVCGPPEMFHDEDPRVQVGK